MAARSVLAAAALLAALLASAARAAVPGASDACVQCHERVTPGIVQDWRLSRHAGVDVACADCHGTDHFGEKDAARAALPTPATCATCHAVQVEQFERGKHARAWVAVQAIPTFHHLERSAPGDRSGCAACHRIGLKPPEEAAALKKAGLTHGFASCDACHTRHLFSKAEARRPEACRRCHGDGDNMQWNAWVASKHGVRHHLVASGILPPGAAAPTCQRCHMPEGDHAVRAPWGSLGMRLPLPDDPQWAKDRATLFRALGVLDAAGGDGPRLRAIMDAGTSHLEKLDYENERARLERVCKGCHAPSFVRQQIDTRDAILKEADHVVAESVRAVVPLYERGVLKPTANGKFPDLVTGADRSPIERRLAETFFDIRARLVATAFHMSPAWVEWRARLDKDLDDIRRSAAELARAGPKKADRPPAKRATPAKAPAARQGP
jgi:ssDNA-binding Zn-finger/Zn-ribbon topoisomerase 1